MPKFFYKARSFSGELEEGFSDAKDEKDLVSKLSSKGLFPVVIKRSHLFQEEKKDALKTDKVKSCGKRQKISKRQLIEFTNQLSTLLNAGVSLVSALAMVSQQIETDFFKQICMDIKDRVNKGQSLSFALSQYPEVFSQFYVALVSAGEKGAFLDKALLRLYEILEYEDEVQGSVVSELVYPALVILIGFVSVLFILFFVVPKMRDVLLDMGQSLPIVTRVLLWLSGSLISYWWLWLLLFGAVAVFLWIDFNKSADMNKVKIDSLLIKSPIIGNMIVKIETGRFIKVFGVLLDSGISAVDALEISANLITNSIIRNHVIELADKLRHGVSLASAVEEAKVFPPMLSGAIATGQESGTLDMVLLKLGDYYEKDVRRQIKMAVSMLGPISILTVGIFIGAIVISVLLPIFQMNVG